MVKTTAGDAVTHQQKVYFKILSLIYRFQDPIDA